MDIDTLVELADNLIFTKTRQHLTSLQKEVLKGTLNGKKYPQIADDCKRHPDHIKQVGTKLWKLLSDILGKNIKKSNARSILEKFHFSHISNIREIFSGFIRARKTSNIMDSKSRNSNRYFYYSPRYSSFAIRFMESNTIIKKTLFSNKKR